MSEDDPVTRTESPENLEIERLRQRYGLYKIIVGTTMVAVVTAALPFIIEYSKISLDTESSRRDFVTEYTQLLERDPEAQIALVEYFAHVLPDDGQRSLWVAYRDHLSSLRERQTEAEARLATLALEDLSANLAEMERLRLQIEAINRQLRPVVPVQTLTECIRSVKFEDVSSEYARLYASMQVTKEYLGTVYNIAARIETGKERYLALERKTRIPWYVVGIIHFAESNLNFSTHLNGDPLTSRTVRIPVGRPREGEPPYTWEEAAEDYLRHAGLVGLEDWGVDRILYRFERLNGFGYRNRGLCSPYLWSFSNHYQRGKFVSDGVFDSDAVSAQVGAAIILSVFLDHSHAVPR